MDAFDSIHPLPAAWLRAGTLAPFVQTYWRRLIEQRYAPNTARAYLCCVAHFAHWSRRRQLVLSALDHHVERFVEQHLPRCTCPDPVQRSRHQIRAALQHLKAVVAEAGIQTDDPGAGPLEVQLCCFDQYLLQAKGLAKSTRIRRGAIVRSLVSQATSMTPTAEELRRFIAQELSRVSPASACAVTTALRSYLRFRAFEVIVSSICYRSSPRLRAGGWRHCRRRCRAMR